MEWTPLGKIGLSIWSVSNRLVSGDCCVLSCAVNADTGEKLEQKEPIRRQCIEPLANEVVGECTDQYYKLSRRHENHTVCLCKTDLCNDKPIGKGGESYGSTGGGSDNDSETEKASEASERSASVSFTVMSLVVTAAQFLRSL